MALPSSFFLFKWKEAPANTVDPGDLALLSRLVLYSFLGPGPKPGSTVFLAARAEARSLEWVDMGDDDAVDGAKGSAAAVKDGTTEAAWVNSCAWYPPGQAEAYKAAGV